MQQVGPIRIFFETQLLHHLCNLAPARLLPGPLERQRRAAHEHQPAAIIPGTRVV